MNCHQSSDALLEVIGSGRIESVGGVPASVLIDGTNGESMEDTIVNAEATGVGLVFGIVLPGINGIVASGITTDMVARMIKSDIRRIERCYRSRLRSWVCTPIQY